MFNVIKFKGCTRCHGDLFLERDDDGVYVSCLQCSAIYVRRLVPIVKKYGYKGPRLKKAHFSSAPSPALVSRSLNHRLISSRAGGEM